MRPRENDGDESSIPRFNFILFFSARARRYGKSNPSEKYPTRISGSYFFTSCTKVSRSAASFLQHTRPSLTSSFFHVNTFLKFSPTRLIIKMCPFPISNSSVSISYARIFGLNFFPSIARIIWLAAFLLISIQLFISFRSTLPRTSFCNSLMSSMNCKKLAL